MKFLLLIGCLFTLSLISRGQQREYPDPYITLGRAKIHSKNVPFDTLLANTSLDAHRSGCMVTEFELSLVIKDDLGVENYFGPFYVKGGAIPAYQLALIKRSKGRLKKVFVEGVKVKIDNVTRSMNPVIFDIIY